MIGNSLGFTSKIFLPDDLAEEKYRILETIGAELQKVRPVSIVDPQNFCKLAEKAAKGEGKKLLLSLM